MQVVFTGQDRAVWKRLLLYPVTFGISRRLWLYRINRELDGHEALGLDHRRHALMLGAPLLGLLLLVASWSAGLPPLYAAAFLVLGFVPSTLVVHQTSLRVGRMLEGSGIPYGPPGLVYGATWMPLLGSLFFIAWVQGRLNRFWAYERQHPEHGFEIELDLTQEPSSAVLIRDALRESYAAGSRFERRRRRRRERRRAWQKHWWQLRRERAAVRMEGGSTPVLPWRRPTRPPLRRLRVTCGRCSHAFEATKDPLRETVLHCPSCGLHEVLPSLRGDPLAGRERAAYASVRVLCPDCSTSFHARRDLHGATALRCPHCGKNDTLPTPERTDATAAPQDRS